VEPIVAEEMAGLHAVGFSREVGMFDIILEGEAFQIINKINL
jgi:hypothetical protein